MVNNHQRNFSTLDQMNIINSSGMSNISNTAVDDRFFEKHEYHAFTPDQKNTLRLKRIKCGHVGKGHCGYDNGTENSSGKGPTFKSLTGSIAALTIKIDKFSLPDDDDEYEYSEEEDGTSNRSNAAFTRQIKNKKHGGNWKANLSSFTMLLGYVGRVEEGNMSELDSHADCRVC
jgi:hypothetical protein